MKLFFDTEFTGLHKRTSLISIGIVAENGERFYGEFSTYKKNQCDDWIKENVLKHTILGGKEDLRKKLSEDRHTKVVVGTKTDIRNELKEWIKEFDDIQFISDVSHYDFVLLIDIFGCAFDLPNSFSPACHDINQDIARFCKISDREAFDKNREELLLELNGIIPKGVKHNSLYDAEVIRRIYDLTN